MLVDPPTERRPTNRTPTQQPGCRAPTPPHGWRAGSGRPADARRHGSGTRCARRPPPGRPHDQLQPGVSDQHEHHPAGGQQEQVRGNPRRVEDGPTLQQTARRTCFNSSAVVATRGDPRHGGHHWWLRRRRPSCPPGNWIIKPPGPEQPLPQAYGGSARIGRPAAGPDARLVGSHAATTCVVGGGPATVPTPHRRRRHSCA